VPAHAENASRGHLHVHCFQGAVEPKAVIETFPKQHQQSIIAASTVGILRRRAPQTFGDELDSAAEWLLECLQRFHAQSFEGAEDGPSSVFIRTDRCSPKDGIQPGAGPYNCSFEDARRFIDACVTSKRVVQGLRTGDGSKLPAKSMSQLMHGPAVQWQDGPWQVFQKTPLHVAHPPQAGPSDTGSSLIIQPWSKLVRPECEFRCFVRDNGVRAVSQYCWYEHLPWLDGLNAAQKTALCRSIQLFQRYWLRPRFEAAGFMLPSYTMDVVVLPMAGGGAGTGPLQDFALLPTSSSPDDPAAPGSCDAFGVRLLELNPFGAHLSSGSGLFNWRTDTAWMYGYSGIEEDTGNPANTDEPHGTSESCPVQLRWLTVCGQKVTGQEEGATLCGTTTN